MNRLETIEIPISKTKITLLLLGCLGFVAVGICFVANPQHFTSPIARSPAKIFIGGCLSTLFFGYIGIFILKRIFDSSPGLTISDEGITDNSGGTPAGFIPWSDVVAVREFEVAGQRAIVLAVKDGSEYIQRQKGPLKRWIMKKNFTMYGKGIGISPSSLKIGFADLKQLIETRLKEYKAKMP